MKSSRVDSLLRSLRELGGPLRATGVTGAAPAWVLARIAETQQSTPLVVICPTDDAMEEIACDLETLAPLFLRLNLEVERLPTWDQSPYSPISPSLKTRLARMGVLSSIVAAASQTSQTAGASRTSASPATSALPGRKIYLVTLVSAAQATMPRLELLRHTQHLELGQSIESRESFIRRLSEAGYLRVDPVEDPGAFAVRGEIIDIFPPGCPRPFRVELFDDQVERIREYDPSTQRTVDPPNGKSLPKLTIPPAREVLVNAQTTPRLRERLKARADDLGISRAVRDPILQNLQATLVDGVYPDRSDAWAPFAYEKHETFWDYLPQSGGPAAADDTGWPIIWIDELACQQEWDGFLEHQRHLAPQATEAGIIVPAVEELYRWSTAEEGRLQARSRVFLDRLDLTDASDIQSAEEMEREAKAAVEALESPAGTGLKGGKVPTEDSAPASKHRFFIRPNRDLTGGHLSSLGELETKFKTWIKQGYRIAAFANTQSQLERIRFLFEERSLPCRMGETPQSGIIALALGSVSEGFRWPAEGLVVVTESEILGEKHVKKQKRVGKSQAQSAAKDWSGLQALTDLSVGDAIVHVDHGIGRYQGIVRLDLSGAPSDFLLLEYASRDKLYLPVYRLNVIQKYVGSGETAQLDRLGTGQFTREKERVREAVKKLAVDLVQLYAQRKIQEGVVFSPRDSAFRDFESQFPFEETIDQLKAIDDTLADMESGRVMDRLICGDVGYGKTEVAMRAAFRAVSDGKQVAVLVPTTVLAHQHEQSFKARLRDYPLNIDSVSRFKNAKEQKTVLESLAKGRVDIIVGTHRLLSRDVEFQDLGLVIVDEEHRFGVEHKEKLKALKLNTHVLTLTATPIPRTLHMALAGLREISLINTPPVDRLPIRTYVSKYDEPLIQRAIEVELSRGGQVFFVHNRVGDIYEVANRIRELVPQAAIAVGHGQMGEGELEKAMISFYKREANILVCTSIIESGLDLPTANTIIINRADAFGLAQLYQIRGRVGRGQNRGYAYLLLPSEGLITEEAKRRLEVIQRFVELGSGFSIASHDLELRGGGDLLGPQQSGHIAAVGFDLYTELLEEAIRELQGKPPTPETSRREPEIKAPFSAYLSEVYVPDVHQRLSIYRRLSSAATDIELTQLEEEMRDRFGELPVEAQNLAWLIRIKQVLKIIGIDVLTVGSGKVSMVPGPGSRLDPVRAIALISSEPGRYQLTPDSKFVAQVNTQSLRDLFFSLETLFKDLLPRSR